MGVSRNDIQQQSHDHHRATHSAEKFVPSGGTLYRPCRSRTDPLRPPRRSWNTHRRFRCARAATRLGESWSNTSNISGDHTRTTSACTPSEAPYRTVWSSIRTVSGPAPSPPPPRPHPQTERQRSARLCEGLRHCHHFLRASFSEVPSSFSAADAHHCFHPHDCLPLSQGLTGNVVYSKSQLGNEAVAPICRWVVLLTKLRDISPVNKLVAWPS